MTELAYFGYEAELLAEIERLKERCEVYKGQVKWGSDEIERLRSQSNEQTAIIKELRETCFDLRSLNAELVAALEQIIAWDDMDAPIKTLNARAALAKVKEGK